MISLCKHSFCVLPPADAAWLCGPDWSRRDQAVDTGRDIAIHRNFPIWPEPTPSAASGSPKTGEAA